MCAVCPVEHDPILSRVWSQSQSKFLPYFSNSLRVNDFQKAHPIFRQMATMAPCCRVRTGYWCTAHGLIYLMRKNQPVSPRDREWFAVLQAKMHALSSMYSTFEMFVSL